MTITGGLREEFARNRYALVRGLLDQATVDKLYDHAVSTASKPTAYRDDMVPTAASVYGDPVTDHVLEVLGPSVGDLACLELLPTYSYYRLYKSGDVLKRHVDRPACEISLSVNLGPKTDSPWPLWVEGPQGPASFELNPGDAVLYRGIECAHWREKLVGSPVAQLFLHYVDRDGPHREWKFDKRTRLGVTPRG